MLCFEDHPCQLNVVCVTADPSRDAEVVSLLRESLDDLHNVADVLILQINFSGGSFAMQEPLASWKICTPQFSTIRSCATPDCPLKCKALVSSCCSIASSFGFACLGNIAITACSKKLVFNCVSLYAFVTNLLTSLWDPILNHIQGTPRMYVAK